MSDLQERLTRAFVDVFSANAHNPGGCGAEYYGVRLEDIAGDGSELDLVLTFLAGNCYCCFEFVDHFDYYEGGRAWSRLRGYMDRYGLGGLRLPVLRGVRVEIEAGAMMKPSSKKSTYTMGEREEHDIGRLLPPDHGSAS